jgi:trimeric autotransporter adhesin
MGALVVVVNDAEAVYPVRIDPTFSDANWISMGGIPGADGSVSAAVVDGSGNLYIGGDFTAVGDVIANHIAKWNGSSWSALGSGMGGVDYGNGTIVYALAVSGSDLYVGGQFTTAGGSAATNIAKWDGSSWSALGSGVNGYAVYALAVSGSDLYAGGSFSMGGVSVNPVAKWDGSSWSALGSGMGGGPQGGFKNR